MKDEEKLLSLKAGILDQTRRRPHSLGQRPYEGKIVNVLLKLKSLGRAENTLKFVSDRLKYLAKNVNLDNPDLVNLFIANKECSESYKDTLVKAYGYYAKFNNIPYVKPRFRYERNLPKIPTKEAIMKVISASSKKYATIFKILMETGIMPYELSKTTLKDIDSDTEFIIVLAFDMQFERRSILFMHIPNKGS